MISIRTFQFPADYAGAFELWSNAGEGLGISPSDQPGEIEKKLLRDPDLFLVAEDDGQLVGTVIGGFDGRRGMVYHLGIAHEHRRKGLAKRLMQELETRLQAKGCIIAYLLVKKGNQAALSLYEESGWEEMDHVLICRKTF